MLVDEGAHQQIPLTVDQDHQVQQAEHAGSSPACHSATPYDKSVGQEQRHPNEIASVQQLLNEETLDGTIFTNRCQEVWLYQHHRCLLGGKTTGKVEDEQEGREVQHHFRCLLLGGQPSKEGTECNKLYDKNG